MSALTDFYRALRDMQGAHEEMAKARHRLLLEMEEAGEVWRREGEIEARVTHSGGEPDLACLDRETLAVLITDPLAGGLIDLRPQLKGWRNAPPEARRAVEMYAPRNTRKRPTLLVK